MGKRRVESVEVVIASMDFPVIVSYHADRGEYATIAPISGELPGPMSDLRAVRLARGLWVVIRWPEMDPRYVPLDQWIIIVDQSSVYLHMRPMMAHRDVVDALWCAALESRDWDGFGEGIAAIYLTEGNPSGAIIA